MSASLRATAVASRRDGEAIAPAAPSISTSARSPAPAAPYLACQVEHAPDGSIHCTFIIAPDVARRLKNRAQNVPLGQYLWDNVLHGALDAHVY